MRVRRQRESWRPTLANRHALLLVAPLLLVLVGLVVYPLVRLTIDSFTSGAGLGNYEQVLESSAGRRALAATTLAAAIVAFVSVAIGGLLAWYARTARSRLARVTIWLAVLVPFCMGTVTRNYAMVLLLSDNGPLNDITRALGLGTVSVLYTWTGVMIGMVYTMLPYAVLSLYGVFMTIDETLIAAARNLGASRLRALTSITIPLAMPGLVASLALLFAISLGFYVTPVLLGGAQAPFMATLIQDYLFVSFEYPLAAAASVLLLAVAVVVLALAFLAVRHGRLLRAAA